MWCHEHDFSVTTYKLIGVELTTLGVRLTQAFVNKLIKITEKIKVV